MNILVVDSKARGHAEAWMAAKSPHTDRLWTTQESPIVQAIADLALTSTGEPITHLDARNVADFSVRNQIDLALVTNEDAFEAGTTDALREAGITVFGPSYESAKLETRKAEAKQAEAELGIPTAEPFGIFEQYDYAIEFAKIHGFPLYGKRDLPAGGKGVGRCDSLHDIHHALVPILNNVDFSLTQKIILEAGLEGFEISLHAWCHGIDYDMFPFAMMDHKTIHANDEGPMTGGMGVVAPLPGLSPEDIEALGETFVRPILKWAYDRGQPIIGMLYPGLKLTPDGPKLIEYNVRPGGPETEAWAPRLLSDYVEVSLAFATGDTKNLTEILWNDTAMACIVAAAKGYPLKPVKGAVITGYDDIDDPNVEVFDYGSRLNSDGELEVNSGRVFSIVAVGQEGDELPDVINRGQKATEQIKFEGKQARSDIGHKALSPEFKQTIQETRHLF